VPTALARFLTDSRFAFVGVGVHADADKMCIGYGLEVGNTADLRGLTEMLSPDWDVSSMTRGTTPASSNGATEEAPR
jgi:hypothetical protein